VSPFVVNLMLWWVVHVVWEVLQLFQLIRSDYKHINITEPADGLMGCPVECCLLRVFCENVGDHR
jgi:hypothetical protein